MIFFLIALPVSWTMKFPEPFGFIFTYFAALPLILVTAQVVTKAIINDVLILKVCYSSLSPSIALTYIFRLRENWRVFLACRGRVRIAVLKTFPSTGRYCRSTVAVRRTMWSAQSMLLWPSGRCYPWSEFWSTDMHALFVVNIYIAAMFSLFVAAKPWWYMTRKLGWSHFQIHEQDNWRYVSCNSSVLAYLVTSCDWQMGVNFTPVQFALHFYMVHYGRRKLEYDFFFDYIHVISIISDADI